MDRRRRARTFFIALLWALVLCYFCIHFKTATLMMKMMKGPGETSTAKTVSIFEPESKPGPVTVPKPVIGPGPTTIPKPVIEPEPIELNPVVDPEPISGAKPVVEPESVIVAKPVVEPEPKIRNKPVVDPESIIGDKHVVEPEPIIGAKPVVELEPIIGTKPVVDPEPESVSENSTMSTLETSLLSKPNKLIMLWSAFWGQRHDHGLGSYGHSPFVDQGCDVTACATTADRSQLKESDAVVLHWGDTWPHDLPLERHPSQVWVMFNIEPAEYFKKDDRYLDGKINWTMTYRFDADVVAPHGEFRPIGSWSNHGRPPPLATGMNPALAFVHQDDKNIGLVSWMVSACDVPSKRHLYVKELAKHIQVDIYGKCGNKSCPAGDRTLCDNVVYNKYKFYLAFENSLCRDYVTEKFFQPLHHGSAVPVVYGAADYRRIAPPHSYIDANDFRSPRLLADYLKMLDKNDALYQEYHSWRDHYQVVMLSHLCYLCAKLHDPNMPQTKVYDSYSQWFFPDEYCRRPSWDVAPITSLGENLGEFPDSWRDPSFRNRSMWHS